MKKTFKIRLRVRNCDKIFKEGLEPGVLGQVELEYNLEPEEYERPLFLQHLLGERDKLISDIVISEVQEVK